MRNEKKIIQKVSKLKNTIKEKEELLCSRKITFNFNKNTKGRNKEKQLEYNENPTIDKNHEFELETFLN